MKTQKTKSPRIRKAQVPPTLSDPHLAALLLFIGGVNSDDDGRAAARFARMQAAAATMLTTPPITAAFDLSVDRPDVYSVVGADVRQDLRTWTDPAGSKRAYDAIEAAWHEENDDRVSYKDVRDMLPSYIDAGVRLGACLMYELLKGGAR